jgi:hypothetical protein
MTQFVPLEILHKSAVIGTAVLCRGWRNLTICRPSEPTLAPPLLVASATSRIAFNFNTLVWPLAQYVSERQHIFLSTNADMW